MPRVQRTKEEIKSDIETQTKKCCICYIRKDFTDFYNFKNKSDNKSYRCKLCDDQARYNYRTKNIDSVRIKERNRGIKHRYGMSPDQYNDLLKSQNYVCGICKGVETKNLGKTVSSFSIDHCHTTGKIRGLLCNNCNRGLGLLGDNKQNLIDAINYLNKHD